MSRFSVEESFFGAYRMISLSNAETQECAKIIPSFGANVHELVLLAGEPVSILDGICDPSLLADKGKFRGAWLIPFPNRIKDGTYTFRGATYRLPINHPSQGHAIHGFLYDRPFDVVERNAGATSAQLILDHRYAGDIPGFPFPFRAVLRLVLDKRGFSAVATIVNTGVRDMPGGLGWHPYFSLGIPADELLLKLPVKKQVLVDDRLIPTGKTTAYNEFRYERRIGATSFDTCFLTKAGGCETVIMNPKAGVSVTVWQDAALGFLQVYTPNDRRTIAIEPMTSAPDAFNNSMGLVTIPPQGSLAATIRVSVSRKI